MLSNKTIIYYIKRLIALVNFRGRTFENISLLNGSILANQVKKMDKIKDLSDVEFSIFSQFGDDGIIQYLINKIEVKNKTFIEFGVEDYLESNTRFLLMHDNWSGLCIDGDDKNIRYLKSQSWFWKYDLCAEGHFLTKENINELLADRFEDIEIGLLHVDIDGNDYWVWKEINSVKPIILILEYNSVFGIERRITIPYREDFTRSKAYFNNLYWGASLAALNDISEKKGYSLIGCNRAGNNAYFIKNEYLGEIEKKTVEEAFVLSKYRESRSQKGKLTYLRGKERYESLKGLPVYNIETEKLEEL